MNGRGVSYIVVRVVGLLHPLPRIDGDNSGRPAIVAASRLTGDAPDHRETDSNGIAVVQQFQIGGITWNPGRVVPSRISGILMNSINSLTAPDPAVPGIEWWKPPEPVRGVEPRVPPGKGATTPVKGPATPSGATQKSWGSHQFQTPPTYARNEQNTI